MGILLWHMEIEIGLKTLQYFFLTTLFVGCGHRENTPRSFPHPWNTRFINHRVITLYTQVNTTNRRFKKAVNLKYIKNDNYYYLRTYTVMYCRLNVHPDERERDIYGHLFWTQMTYARGRAGRTAAAAAVFVTSRAGRVDGVSPPGAKWQDPAASGRRTDI